VEKSVSVQVSILSVLALFAAIPARSQALPDGDGKQLVEMACTRCHGTDKFTVERHTRDDWAEEVDVMRR
jgi:cytochrome c5